jgi:hypothetical protein
MYEKLSFSWVSSWEYKAISTKGNGDSKSEKTEKKEDVEQLTKGKSEEEAEMKRYLPSLSKKTDPSVTVSLVLSCYFEVYPLNQKSHMVRWTTNVRMS